MRDRQATGVRGRRRLAIVALMLAVPVLTGCAAQYSGGGDGPLKGAKIAFGSKDFTEQQVLGQIAVQYLRHEGADVWDQTGLVSSAAVRAALQKKDIDAYWEYTGTGWVTYLGNDKPIQESKAQYDAVKKEDAAKNKIDWINPAPLNNTYAFATTAAFAKKNNLKKLSDLKGFLATPAGKKATFCVESEFANRPDGYPGVVKTYGLTIPRNRVKRLDAGLIYSQTGNGVCTFGEVFTTDGRIKGLDLYSLVDDKRFFPFYNAAITINQSALKKYPQFQKVMEPVARRLTSNVISSLNTKVDIDGILPEKVARQWLEDEGLTKKK